MDMYLSDVFRQLNFPRDSYSLSACFPYHEYDPLASRKSPYLEFGPALYHNCTPLKFRSSSRKRSRPMWQNHGFCWQIQVRFWNSLVKELGTILLSGQKVFIIDTKNLSTFRSSPIGNFSLPDFQQSVHADMFSSMSFRQNIRWCLNLSSTETIYSFRMQSCASCKHCNVSGSVGSQIWQMFQGFIWIKILKRALHQCNFIGTSLVFFMQYWDFFTVQVTRDAGNDTGFA